MHTILLSGTTKPVYHAVCQFLITYPYCPDFVQIMTGQTGVKVVSNDLQFLKKLSKEAEKVNFAADTDIRWCWL